MPNVYHLDLHLRGNVNQVQSGEGGSKINQNPLGSRLCPWICNSWICYLAWSFFFLNFGPPAKPLLKHWKIFYLASFYIIISIQLLPGAAWDALLYTGTCLPVCLPVAETLDLITIHTELCVRVMSCKCIRQAQDCTIYRIYMI